MASLWYFEDLTAAEETRLPLPTGWLRVARMEPGNSISRKVYRSPLGQELDEHPLILRALQLAKKQPLPPGWSIQETTIKDDEGKSDVASRFYFNATLQVSLWDHPLLRPALAEILRREGYDPLALGISIEPVVVGGTSGLTQTEAATAIASAASVSLSIAASMEGSTKSASIDLSTSLPNEGNALVNNFAKQVPSSPTNGQLSRQELTSQRHAIAAKRAASPPPVHDDVFFSSGDPQLQPIPRTQSNERVSNVRLGKILTDEPHRSSTMHLSDDTSDEDCPEEDYQVGFIQSAVETKNMNQEVFSGVQLGSSFVPPTGGLHNTVIPHSTEDEEVTEDNSQQPDSHNDQEHFQPAIFRPTFNIPTSSHDWTAVLSAFPSALEATDSANVAKLARQSPLPPQSPAGLSILRADITAGNDRVHSLLAALRGLLAARQGIRVSFLCRDDDHTTTTASGGIYGGGRAGANHATNMAAEAAMAATSNWIASRRENGETVSPEEESAAYEAAITAAVDSILQKRQRATYLCTLSADVLATLRQQPEWLVAAVASNKQYGREAMSEVAFLALHRLCHPLSCDGSFTTALLLAALNAGMEAGSSVESAASMARVNEVETRLVVARALLITDPRQAATWDPLRQPLPVLPLPKQDEPEYTEDEEVLDVGETAFGCLLRVYSMRRDVTSYFRAIWRPFAATFVVLFTSPAPPAAIAMAEAFTARRTAFTPSRPSPTLLYTATATIGSDGAFNVNEKDALEDISPINSRPKHINLSGRPPTPQTVTGSAGRTAPYLLANLLSLSFRLLEVSLSEVQLTGFPVSGTAVLRAIAEVGGLPLALHVYLRVFLLPNIVKVLGGDHDSLGTEDLFSVEQVSGVLRGYSDIDWWWGGIATEKSATRAASILRNQDGCWSEECVAAAHAETVLRSFLWVTWRLFVCALELNDSAVEVFTVDAFLRPDSPDAPFAAAVRHLDGSGMRDQKLRVYISRLRSKLLSGSSWLLRLPVDGRAAPFLGDTDAPFIDEWWLNGASPPKNVPSSGKTAKDGLHSSAVALASTANAAVSSAIATELTTAVEARYAALRFRPVEAMTRTVVSRAELLALLADVGTAMDSANVSPEAPLYRATAELLRALSEPIHGKNTATASDESADDEHHEDDEEEILLLPMSYLDSGNGTTRGDLVHGESILDEWRHLSGSLRCVHRYEEVVLRLLRVVKSGMASTLSDLLASPPGVILSTQELATSEALISSWVSEGELDKGATESHNNHSHGISLSARHTATSRSRLRNPLYGLQAPRPLRLLHLGKNKSPDDRRTLAETHQAMLRSYRPSLPNNERVSLVNSPMRRDSRGVARRWAAGGRGVAPVSPSASFLAPTVSRLHSRHDIARKATEIAASEGLSTASAAATTFEKSMRNHRPIPTEIHRRRVEKARELAASKNMVSQRLFQRSIRTPAPTKFVDDNDFDDAEENTWRGGDSMSRNNGGIVLVRSGMAARGGKVSTLKDESRRTGGLNDSSRRTHALALSRPPAAPQPFPHQLRHLVRPDGRFPNSDYNFRNFGNNDVLEVDEGDDGKWEDEEDEPPLSLSDLVRTRQLLASAVGPHDTEAFSPGLGSLCDSDYSPLRDSIGGYGGAYTDEEDDFARTIVADYAFLKSTNNAGVGMSTDNMHPNNSSTSALTTPYVTESMCDKDEVCSYDSGSGNGSSIGGYSQLDNSPISTKKSDWSAPTTEKVVKPYIATQPSVVSVPLAVNSVPRIPNISQPHELNQSFTTNTVEENPPMKPIYPTPSEEPVITPTVVPTLETTNVEPIPVIRTVNRQVLIPDKSSLLNLLVTGFHATKHGRSGAPKEKRIWLDELTSTIHWENSSPDPPSRRLTGLFGGNNSSSVGEIPLTTECSVVRGIQTPVLSRAGKVDPVMCLSIVSPTRTLDLSFSSTAARDAAFRALHIYLTSL